MSKRTKQVAERQIVTETFSGMESLIDTMEARPLNQAFASYSDNLSSQRKDKSKWSGVETYDQAMEIIRKGYTDHLERISEGVLNIANSSENKRERLKADFVGFVPHVPNMIMNIPETMLNRRPQRKQVKTIHLIYSFCASANVTTNSLIKGGINFIGLANSLEMQGYRVKIDICFISLTPKTVATLLVNVKEYDQNINLLKLAFPLIHPSMLRRVSFKWLETAQGIKDRKYTIGYGQTLGSVYSDMNKESDFLKSRSIINQEAYYCNVTQAIKASGIDDLAFDMGLL